MKKKNWLVMSLFISSMAFAVSSCSDDNNNDNTVDDSAMDPVKTALINDYIDLTVLPTYDDMKAKVWDLMDAVTVMFESETATQDQLNAVCAAWRNAREPWELSEGFLYGPAANYSIDPSLDSWPLDQVNIEALLNSSQNIAEQTFAQDNSGFHTLEYLIFLNGNPRDISSISSRQKEYIYYVTKKLLDDTVRLWAEWHGEKAISDQRDAELIENDEITIAGGEDGFAELLRNPNMYQKYKTKNHLLEEILDKMPADRIVMGNISPSKQFLGGTPDSMAQAVKELLEKCAGHKNFLLSSGCDIPPKSSWDNIRAFFRASEEFYAE